MIPINLRPLIDTSAPRVVRRRLEKWEREWRGEEAHEYFTTLAENPLLHGLRPQDVAQISRWANRIYESATATIPTLATRGRMLLPVSIIGPNDPTKILKSWHRADLGVTTGSGGGVASALDQSGNGWTVSQATVTNQPAISTSAINGRTGWVFDASGDHLLYPSGFAAMIAGGNDKPFASWTVCRFATDVLTTTKYSYLWGLGYTGGNNPYIEFYGGYTSTGWVCSKSSNVGTVVASVGSAPGVAANTNYFVEYYHSGTTVEVVVNGTSCTMTNAGALDTGQADVNSAAIHALPRGAVVTSNAQLTWTENGFIYGGKPNQPTRSLLRTYVNRQFGV